MYDAITVRRKAARAQSDAETRLDGSGKLRRGEPSSATAEDVAAEALMGEIIAAHITLPDRAALCIPGGRGGKGGSLNKLMLPFNGSKTSAAHFK